MDKAKAQAAVLLGDDDRFQEVIEAVRQEQAERFLNPNASGEEVEDAHSVIRALDKLTSYIRSARNSLTVAERTGQDR